MKSLGCRRFPCLALLPVLDSICLPRTRSTMMVKANDSFLYTKNYTYDNKYIDNKLMGTTRFWNNFIRFNNICVTNLFFNILCMQFNISIWRSIQRRCSPRYRCWLYFTHMWKTLAWPHHFKKRRVCEHKTSLLQPRSIVVPVPSRGIKC